MVVAAAVTGPRRAEGRRGGGVGRRDRDPVGGAGAGAAAGAGNAAETRPIPTTTATTDDDRGPPAADRPSGSARRRRERPGAVRPARSRPVVGLRRRPVRERLRQSDRTSATGRRRIAIGAVGAVSGRPAGPGAGGGRSGPGATTLRGRRPATTATAASQTMTE